jgi:hypothetical protein
MDAREVIERFVRAASDGDENAAARCVTEDAVIVLTGGRTLPQGPAGARAFAARHAESDGRKQSVELRDIAQRDGGYWLASLHLANTEVATGDTLYEFDVGGVIRVDGDLIARVEAFASPQEAEAALDPQSH